MIFEVRENSAEWNRILARVKDTVAENLAVKAGVLGKGAARDDGSDVDNVKLAAIHEFGVPEKGIPERSFIRGPLAAHLPVYRGMLGKLIRQALAEKITFRAALDLMGMRMAADMRNAINTSSGGNAPFVPNKPETIKRKGSSRPLVDTGQLVRSLTHAVVEGGE